jgi:histidine ammonia-lyase
MDDTRDGQTTVCLDGESLDPGTVAAVAREGATVTVDDAARERVRAARERVREVVDAGETVYGLNTGFGDLVDERVDATELERLQHNLLRSHASGTGPELDRGVVRALLVARINGLLVGRSGVRERVVEHLVAMLNRGVHPVVRSRGSLGASGDLAPLAHLALVLVGEGEAEVVDEDGSERLSGEAALAAVGLEPLSLAPKEGLALVNGTQLTAALAALVVVDAERVVRSADVAGALTTEVTMGTTASAAPAIQAARPHEGQAASAENVRRVTRESAVVESHRNCDRVQDAYSVRCLPQVHGAVRDAVAHLRAAVEVELNAATDNPLVFAAEEVDARASGTGSAAVVSGGNFHGAPLAHRLDYVVGALADLAAICERRVDRLLNPATQEPHLPDFLARESGLESGLMIAQYTAAALVNELRAEGRTATDSTPVSGNQEDHVSMSATAALTSRRAVERTATVVGVELLCGAEASRYVEETPGAGTAAAVEAVREVAPPLDGDRPLHRDLDRVGALVQGGLLVERVADAVGELG